MIKRQLTFILKHLAEQFRVIAVLGPRQSGKTTITQETFNKHAYVSLEDTDNRSFAETDPRSFLQLYHNEYGIILDEIQHVPSLLSYIQTEVDRTKRKGYFILTGSQNFLLNEKITQTLAGRVMIFTLLPLSVQELKEASLLPQDINSLILQGSYPLIYADNVNPLYWYPTYISTYIERDIRQIKNVTNISLFQTFIKLCAGRIGQLLNVSSLANDCGISAVTAESWISLLEMSYILFRAQPHHKNFSKRIVKTPKIYFYDTGIACSLLEINDPKQLATHYLRGGLFESFIFSEILKMQYNKGLTPHPYFWRDKIGHEVDCIIERGGKLHAIEMKAGKTINNDYFTALTYWKEMALSDAGTSYLVYAGDESQKRTIAEVLKWSDITKIMEMFE